MENGQLEAAVLLRRESHSIATIKNYNRIMTFPALLLSFVSSGLVSGSGIIFHKMDETKAYIQWGERG
jgi:hypothetical protein